MKLAVDKLVYEAVIEGYWALISAIIDAEVMSK